MRTLPFRSLVPLFVSTVLVYGCSSGNVANGEARAVTCMAYHGVPISPDLSGMNETYLAKQLRDFRSSHRSDPVISPLAASLSDEQIDDLAAYFSSLTRCPEDADAR